MNAFSRNLNCFRTFMAPRHSTRQRFSAPANNPNPTNPTHPVPAPPSRTNRSSNRHHPWTNLKCSNA